MNKVFIPVSIIVAGLIIAGAVVLTKNADNTKPQVANNERPKIELSPITDQDHIKGNPDAEILIVEYSDFECPYCAMFQGTMKRIADEYVDSGRVAWVYRHFPIQKHETSRPLSEASECVADLGGEDKFWDFTDEIFSRIVKNLEDGKTDYSVKPEEMTDFVSSLGIDINEYNACVSEGRFAQKVEDAYQDGLNIAKVDRGFGTPYNIIVTKDGVQIPIVGNQPYAAVKQLIESILVGDTKSE